jgi:hypothetical protein
LETRYNTVCNSEQTTSYVSARILPGVAVFRLGKKYLPLPNIPDISGIGVHMNRGLRQAKWVLALGVAVTTLGTPKVAAANQSQEDRDQNRNHDYTYGNNQDYLEGLRHGQDDRDHNRDHQYRRRAYNDADRRAYESGYDQGYNRRDRYDRNAYGNYSGRNGRYEDFRNAADQTGFQDGLNQGAYDRQTRHSFRPTKGGNYKSANRGYNSSFGDRNQYKQMYRQAYQRGYQQGYNEWR